MAPESIRYNMVAPHLADLTFAPGPPPEGYLAYHPNPVEPFEAGEHFQFDYRGTPTQVALVRDPQQFFRRDGLGASLRPYWTRYSALGGALIANEAYDTVAFLYLHSLMLDPTHALLEAGLGHIDPLTRDGVPALWAAFGGSHAFSDMTLAGLLAKTASKGSDMGRKGRATEVSLELDPRHTGPIYVPGGMKVGVLHPPGAPLATMKEEINPDWDRGYRPTGREARALQRRMALDPMGDSLAIHAAGMRLFGVPHTGSDQNVGAEWATFLAERAPYNIVGSRAAAPINRGHIPTAATAEGVWSGLEVIHEEFFGGRIPETHIEGSGGIGTDLIKRHRDHGATVTVSDIEVDALLRARGLGVERVYLNEANLRAAHTLEPERADAMIARAREESIPVASDLIDILRHIPGTQILSNNASIEPITPDVADYLASEQSRVLAIYGATNSVAGRHDGSTDYVVWRLQRAGIFFGVDYLINRMGATGVIGRKVGLAHPRRFHNHAHTVADTTQISIKQFRAGTPPFVYWNNRTGRMMQEHLAAPDGHAVGAGLEIPTLTDVPSHAVRQSMEDRARARLEVDRVIFRQPHQHNPSHGSLEKRRRAGVTPTSIQRAEALQRHYGTVPAATSLVEVSTINDLASLLLQRDPTDGVRILFKREDENPTGSFKDRNSVPLLVAAANGVFPTTVETVSTGNHGRAATNAVARVRVLHPEEAAELSSRVWMDRGAYPHKQASIRALGGTVMTEIAGRPIDSYREGEDHVRALVAESGEQAITIPHADPWVVSGYAVMGMEIMEQLGSHGVDLNRLPAGALAVLSPLGSGGLFAGLLEIPARYPGTYAYGVSSAPSDMTFRSLATGKMLRENLPSGPQVLVDGTLATPEEMALRLIPDMAHGVLRVTEADAVFATALLERHGISVEPTSGLPLAGLLLHPNLFAKTDIVVMPTTSANRSERMGEFLGAAAAEPGLIEEHFADRTREIQAAERLGLGLPQRDLREVRTLDADREMRSLRFLAERGPGHTRRSSGRGRSVGI